MARLGRSQPINVIYSDDITSLPIVAGGTGTAASTGTGLVLVVSPVGQGTAAASPTAALNLTARIDGNGPAVASGTGFLIITARLTGSGNAAAGSRPALTGIGGHVDLSGHGDATVAGTVQAQFTPARRPR